MAKKTFNINVNSKTVTPGEHRISKGQGDEIEWVIDNKEQYGIRVMNMSLGHTIQESAEVDPLVQAVERAWEAGIVVVGHVNSR